MTVKAILFDLDGTLLPIDLKTFQLTSGRLFCEKMVAHGYDPAKLGEAQWSGIHAMSSNDGSQLNRDVYFERMREIYGPELDKDIPLFFEYYEKEFNNVKEICGFNPEAGPAVQKLKDMGFRLVMATNAWFPRAGIEARLRWAGVDADLFEFMTLMENSHFCKPNLGYYQEILDRLQLPAEECLMVGNDVQEDMVAEKLGMQLFLMTGDLINRDGSDVSSIPQGGFEELFQFITSKGVK